MVAGEVRRELCPLTCLTFTFVLISGIETSKVPKDPLGARARYYREYRAKASAEQKAIWAERSRLRYQRLKNEKKAKEKKEKKRRQNQAYYRKKKLAGQTLLTPGFEDKSTEDMIEKSAPTTSDVEITQQRIVGKNAVDTRIKGIKEKEVRKSQLLIMKTANKIAVSISNAKDLLRLLLYQAKER